MRTVYNLGYNISQQNGQSIIFLEKDNQPLQTEDIQVVQLKMIQSNRIPHFLPLTVENMDMTTKLHYDIHAKQQLLTFIRNTNITINDFYQLFLNIIKTLENSGPYMLNQENFTLDPHFIYVGEHASDVYLTYFPIKELKREKNINEEIKNLFMTVSREIKGLQENDFQIISNYMRNVSFNITGFKELLLDLMSRQSNMNQVNQMSQVHLGGNLNVNQPTVATNNQKEMQINQPIPKPQKKSKKVNKSKGKLPPLSSRAKVYLFAGALLAIAIIWKLYTMNPTEEMLMISAGASLFVLICVFILLKVWRPGVKRIETEPKELNQQNSEAPQAKQQPVQGTPKESRKQLEWNTMAQVNKQHQHVTAQPIQHEPLPPQQHHDFQQHDHQVVQDTIPSQHQERQQPVHPIGQESIHENQLQHVSESLSQNPSKTINQHATPIQTQREIVQPLPSQETNVAQKEEVKQATSQAQMSPAIAATSMDTALLDDESDDTVLLDESFYGEEEIRPILIRETEDGTVSEIIVDSDQFMIGRNSDLANYLEDTIGVSRKHAEIVKIDEDTYGLKDLDSKNGTRVNGKALVPLKVYELNDGDKFRIGKVDYTFKWETKE